MSLLFEHAVDRFDGDAATLVAADGDALATTDESIPARPVAAFAGHYDSLSHPTESWVCVPLHGADDATATDEYVAYVDHDLRGRLFVVERDGERETVPAEEFERTRLARRLRFWHSDYVPETRPPGYDAPIDDREAPRRSIDPDRLLDGFAAYVDGERTATREANRDRAESRSPRAIDDGGDAAIPRLDPVGEADDGSYRFRVDLGPEREGRRDGDWAYFVENEFGVHQGNEVVVHAVDGAHDAFPVEATVAKIRGLSVWLAIDWSAVAEAATVGARLSGGPIGVSALLNPVPFDRESESIESLRGSELGEVLAGDRPLTFSHPAAARSSPFDPDLNQEQSLAARYALLADDLFCIHGPPGTGKTRTLLEVVRRAVEAGEDVLVCADSNQALDNLVVGESTVAEPDPGSLHAYGQHGSGEFTLRRANPERSRHDVVATTYRDVAARADVVAATNSSAARLHREFDLLVLDEATQSTCTASCIPLARADRVVLAGDHRQLPPYSATEEPPDSSYGLSLFEHLYADGGVYAGVGVQLKTQYRMHRDVAYFPNRAFYDRSLRNGRVVESLPDRPALEGFNVGGPVDRVDHSYANETEAATVTYVVDDLLDVVPADGIGVVTPYAAQVRLLRRRLGDVDGADPVTVDTIDAFQGSERTAIVVSLVRSNGEGSLGFLGRPEDGPRRLNVALTRARRYCAVVADFHTLRYDADGKDVDLYTDVYDHFSTTGRLRDVSPDLLPT